MNSISHSGLLFFSILQLYAQDFSGKNVDVDDGNTNSLHIEDFSYPVFFDGEVHSNFTVAYEFDTEFLIELQGFYDTYRLNDVFDLSLRSKYYLSNKLYFFSGIGLEKERDKHGFRPPPLRVKLINGFGYDIDQKFSLEAKQNLHFNKTNFGNYGTPNLFSLSGKYKF